MAFKIGYDQRVCFFGRTRSGKTTMARGLLADAGTTRWTVLDPKHTYSDGDTKVVARFDPKLRRQIVRVPPDRHEQERWAECIDAVWRRGDGILYVDELTLITPSTRILPELGKAIRTGGEIGLGTWCGSQRPKDVPSAVYTETEHFFIFRLAWKDDRDKVVSFTEDEVGRLLPRLRGHDCVYYGVDYGSHWLRPVLKKRRR